MKAINSAPVNSSAARPPTVEAEPANSKHRDKLGVLVVDDDQLVRIMVQLGLERNGFEVWLASDGREAVHLYQTHRNNIGVVLLDVHMPAPDGPAILDALRILNPNVVTCFMTGDGSACEPEKLRKRGAAHVIAKPFLLNELANILKLLAHGVPAELLPSAGVSQA